MNKHILYQAVVAVADERCLSNHEAEILCSCYAAGVSEKECAALLRKTEEEVHFLYMRIAIKSCGLILDRYRPAKHNSLHYA